ncbi:hypothetical protein HDF26_004861 [Pedobacter cryoconitis]|uniref:DUF4402 domain-containing protein n=1 Tax=Pedobacter cryoconitis TaxID=188932 RepID=UPI00160C02DE|nr:DUF4402 domain-containing protein [Pedobacter cryoconitis]MBB6274387.1 hypothetical protein [Pedobacter cryoconitis]
MKPILTISGITYLIILLTTSISSAQVVADANVSANIVTQVSISRIVDMNFGEIKGTTIAGTVVLTPAETRIATGGVQLVPGKAETATFTIDGQGSYTYSVTLPSYTMATAAGNTHIIVDNFKSLPAETGSLSDPLTLNVGATLNVAPDQPTGHYTSATPFDVIINYN